MNNPYISQSKQRELLQRMKKLAVSENDLLEKFILGSGKGGQKLNKTASCVYLRHEPSGIEIKCQRERSRAVNRFLARRELCDRIEDGILARKTARKQKEEKIRRQKQRRSRRQKERMLEGKRRHSEKKKMRKSVVKSSGNYGNG